MRSEAQRVASDKNLSKGREARKKSLTAKAVLRKVTQELEEATKSGSPAEEALERYLRLAETHLPVERRLQLYAFIARRVKTNPFAAQKALERIDALTGIVTMKERKEAEAKAPPGPMFILPPGTRVAVTVNPGSTGQVDLSSTQVVDLSSASDKKSYVKVEKPQLEEPNDDEGDLGRS